MNKAAILHIPQSQYAYANSEMSLTIRLRTKKDDLTECTLFYGDRACMTSPVQFASLPMKITAQDSEFDYYEVTFESPYTRVCYYFYLAKGEEWYYYYADLFTKELPDLELNGTIVEGRSEYYQYPFILRSEILTIPKWFQNAIVYNIFPDSFASGYRTLSNQARELSLDDLTEYHVEDSINVWMSHHNPSVPPIRHEKDLTVHSRLGGTIQGVMANLDYIESMGFNCIYLNPIFVAGEWHKYDVLDYYHIDPCFGTEEEFKKLVDEIHRRNMYIVIDGVFNHTSWYFPAFNDVVQKQENSHYKDWYYDLTFPVKRPADQGELPEYACFAYEKKMPKLNTSNPEVQDYFADVCRYWITNYHIDGWRLDVANEVDRNFWRKFRQAAKSANPEAVLIGEVWENSETWLRGDAFDSTMNYDFRKHCRDYFALGNLTEEEFNDRITQMNLRYPKPIADAQLNLLDTHDVPRFLSLCKGDLEKWKKAFAFLMQSPGVPSMLYGDELGLEGLSELEYRQGMKWEAVESGELSCDREINELSNYVRKMVQMRCQENEMGKKFE